jgi:hypothetical protein
VVDGRQAIQPVRFSTSPYLLEVILFLKFNNKYWHKRTVAKAIGLVQEEDSNERYDKEIAQFGLLNDEDDKENGLCFVLYILLMHQILPATTIKEL